MKLLATCLATALLTGCASNGYENYGTTHGAIVGGSMLAVNSAAKKVIPNRPKTRKAIVVGTGLLGSAYYYERERKARNGADFSDWYGDSKGDAVTPMITAAVVSWYILKKP